MNPDACRMATGRTPGGDPRARCRNRDVSAHPRGVVHLVRVPHLTDDRVVVSLRDSDHGSARIATPGRIRVTGLEVASRLARLVEAAVAHAQATGRPTEIDLDSLLARAEADVARCRSRTPTGDTPVEDGLR
jgi:hypothetical protein